MPNMHSCVAQRTPAPFTRVTSNDDKKIIEKYETSVNVLKKKVLV
jgi:hypothetical protein